MKSLNIVYKLLMLIIAVAISLGIGTILMNGVPIMEKPGIVQRLSLYLTRNEIESTQNHPIPELRPQLYTVPAEELFSIVQKTVIDLGWRIQQTEPLQHRLHAVVETRLLRFKDDVFIRIEPDTQNTSTLNFRANSRVGRADYGANLGHILQLTRAIQDQLAL